LPDGKQAKINTSPTNTSQIRVFNGGDLSLLIALNILSEIVSSADYILSGSYGSVQYFCKVKIDRPWRFDHKVKEMFTVLPVYDLNLTPSAGIGISAEESKELGSLCCANGTVFITVSDRMR
jgi:hypothetical protein